MKKNGLIFCLLILVISALFGIDNSSSLEDGYAFSKKDKALTVNSNSANGLMVLLIHDYRGFKSYIIDVESKAIFISNYLVDSWEVNND